MKKSFLIPIVFFSVVSCKQQITDGKEKIAKFIPDNTPYISGLLEVTNDTSHHYSEVVVGYFTNHIDFTYDEIFSLSDEAPGVYNTDLMTQLIRSMTWLGMSYQAEKNAKVSVTGPLSHPLEKEVRLENNNDGLYNDVNSSIKLVAGEFYRLDVRLPDGRSYSNTTQIPSEVSIEIPDSIGVKVKLLKRDDGGLHEFPISRPPIIYNHPKESHLRVAQRNLNIDRELLLLEPGEEFNFKDHSNYLRSGSHYGISLKKNNPDTLLSYWGQDLEKPRSKIWMDNKAWFRFSFFSAGIGDNFFPMVDLYAASEEWDKQMLTPLLDAIDNRDTTFFFDVSTILKVGEDGNVLPKEQSDAIGFFAGYFSVYDRATIYPIRNFDLDSLLAANGNK